MRPSAVALALLLAQAPESQQGTVILDDLTRHTGWVMLGRRDASDREWLTRPAFVIDSGEKAGTTAIPSPEDHLLFMDVVPVVILSYGTDGERQAMVFPGGRILSDNDIVGNLYPNSAMVVVKEVRTSLEFGGDVGVWARVEHVPRGVAVVPETLLGSLPRRTGWLALGLRHDRHWVTVPQFLIVSGDRAGTTAIPAPEDRLQVIAPSPVMIRGYRADGDIDAMTFPGPVFNEEDLVGRLPAGAVVVVKDVRTTVSVPGAPDARGALNVWVRVEALPRE